MTKSLGFFFREHPQYFKSIDNLVFGEGVDEFKSYMNNHPIKLIQYIDNKILPENIYFKYHNLKWYDDIKGNDEKLECFVNLTKSIYEEHEEAKKNAVEEECYSRADDFDKLIEKLKKGNAIEYLSKYCVIPKYGFPIDVVELQIYIEGKKDNNYNLTRDLRIAISEYAPDSEVIVDGKKYTSKYISVPKASPFLKNYFMTCHHCKRDNVYISLSGERTCRYCGASIDMQESEYFIEPIYGFKTGVMKESSRMKPKRSYSGEISYVGGGVKDEKKLIIKNVIVLETSVSDELLIMNRSQFYMCPKCGYSEIIKGRN